MKALILSVSILYLISANTIFAQNYSIKGRWNTKLVYSSHKEQKPYHSYMPSLSIEANYGMNRFIEAGAYMGTVGFNNSFSGDFDSHFMALYGLNANFHILPFFIEKDDFRFDLYVTTKIGGNYCNVENVQFRHKKNLPEYGIGIGTAFYLSKKFGLFAEYSYGNFDYTELKDIFYQYTTSPTKLRYGLTMKFK
jgi:hypothetical protein